MLCHDINSGGYNETMEWLKLSQVNAPNSTVLLVLTKLDVPSEEECTSLTRQFVDSLTHLIDKEISSIERKMIWSSESAKDTYEKHVQNYQTILTQLKPDTLIGVSCIAGWEESVQKITTFLLRFAENPKHQISLRPIDKDLFVRIGHLGIKERMIKPDSTFPINLSSVEKVHTPNIRIKTYDRKEFEKQFEAEIVSGDVDIHEQETNRALQKEAAVSRELQLMTFKEVMKEYQKTHAKHNPLEDNLSSTEIQIEAKRSLQILRNSGLIKFFSNNLDFEDIIYNDLNTLVSIMDCVFNHQAKKSLTYKGFEQYYATEMLFEEDLDKLQRLGILSGKLLRCLLHQSKCTIPALQVAKLFSKLKVAFEFEEYVHEEDISIFIPFFLDENPPTDLHQRIVQVATTGNNALSLETVLMAAAPQVFFYTLMVKLYEKVHEHFAFLDSVVTWNRGIYVALNSHSGELLMMQNDDHTITFFIRVDISEATGHQLLWSYVEFVLQGSLTIKIIKAPGLPLDYILKCSHCKIEGLEKRKRFLVQKMLSQRNQKSQTFSCGSDIHIPRALIAPLPEGINIK